MRREIQLDWAMKAGKVIIESLSSTAGRVAAAAAIVAAVASVLTNVVTSHWNPVLTAGVILFTAASAVLAAIQQRNQEAIPDAAIGNMSIYAPFGDGPYGNAAQHPSIFAQMAPLMSALPFPSPTRSPESRAGSRSLVNRASERDLVLRALRAQRPDVIVLHGPSGTGKSALISSVLREANLTQESVRRYDLPGDRFDAKRLWEDVDPHIQSEEILEPDEDILNRLEIAVQSSDGPPVVIVVDSAQYLLDSDTRTIISLELAEAIGVIAKGRRHVKIIFVFQEYPDPDENDWLASADYVYVGPLAREDFDALLQQLGLGEQSDLAGLTTSERAGIFDALQGNPRLAELFRTVLDLPHFQREPVNLARYIAQKPAEGAVRLARELVGCLGDEQRRVMVGLAAYGTAVTIQQLTGLLEAEVPPGRVPALMEELINIGVTAKTSDRYYVPSSGILDILMRLPDRDGPAHLWRRATDLLASSRKEQIRQPEDMEAHFAELSILIRRQMWGSSYELLDTMELQLQRWSAVGLLLKFREAVSGKLRVGYREMVNYNAIGCIYLSRGDFQKSREALDKAFRHAGSVADEYPHGRRKVTINLASLYLDSGDIFTATRCYRDALADAEEHEDVLDRMVALIGLADCFRRHGNYRDTIRCGQLSLSAAQAASSPWAADIAVKLARWHSELNQRQEAFRMLDVAEREAAEHSGDPALRVRCLDGRAELLLGSEELGEARQVAQQALTRALRLNGPITVLQARTSMAMACLQLGDISAARREIDRASPYRREGRSLVVLALQALIAFRADPDGADPERLFARLEREAFQRRERDVHDFAAWDFEGLAICGTQAGKAASLDSAVAAFRRAREEAMPLGLNARMRFWLGLLESKAFPGQMDLVLAAAVGAPS